MTVHVNTGRDGQSEGSEGLVSWMLGRLGQVMCGLRGHDEVLHVENNRVQLRCTSCWHDSPGWDVGQRRPRLRYQGDARRHQITSVKSTSSAISTAS